MKFRFYAFKLCGVIIAFFILQWLIPGFTDLFVLNSAAWVEVWRFVTSIFLHGGLGHIAYNLFALALFGSILEIITSPPVNTSPASLNNCCALLG